MALKKTIEKLNDYQTRLKDKKAYLIKPSHVIRIIEKLKAKDRALVEDIAATHKPDKKVRLEEKRKVVHAQLERAEWLLQEIEKTA